jgi:hypothetical protein
LVRELGVRVRGSGPHTSPVPARLAGGWSFGPSGISVEVGAGALDVSLVCELIGPFIPFDIPRGSVFLHAIVSPKSEV